MSDQFTMVVKTSNGFVCMTWKGKPKPYMLIDFTGVAYKQIRQDGEIWIYEELQTIPEDVTVFSVEQLLYAMASASTD